MVIPLWRILTTGRHKTNSAGKPPSLSCAHTKAYITQSKQYLFQDLIPRQSSKKLSHIPEKNL